MLQSHESLTGFDKCPELRVTALPQAQLLRRFDLWMFARVFGEQRNVKQSNSGTKLRHSNQALGIGRGSRIGTKQPLFDAAIRGFQEQMNRFDRVGIGITMELQRAFGLREAEASRAVQAETLARWERELRESGRVRVIEGTKG